jgi:putative hydrolase of the HAD superfamily
VTRPAPAAVVFDIGGVLERNPRTEWQRRWAERLGRDPDAFRARLDAIWAPGSTGATTLEAIERATAAAFGLDQRGLAELMHDAWAEYLGTLDAGAADFFRSLRPRFRTALLSNSFVGAREREAAAYDLPGMCDLIVYSHEVGLLKPDPHIYALTCERLGVAPAATVFVDDVEANVEAARSAGLDAILFRSAEETIRELAQRGVS